MICLLKFDFFFFAGVTMQVRSKAVIFRTSYSSIKVVDCRAVSEQRGVRHHDNLGPHCVDTTCPLRSRRSARNQVVSPPELPARLKS